MYGLKIINVRLRFCFISHLFLKVVTVLCSGGGGGGGGGGVPVVSLIGVILVSLRVFRIRLWLHVKK